MRKYLEKLLNSFSFFDNFSESIGIDLGSARTVVSVEGRGVIIDEPSIVSINNTTQRLVCFGTEARDMLGRTPRHIDTIKPIANGVISDFDVTQEILEHILKESEVKSKKPLGPYVGLGVPSEVTNVEIRAVHDAAIDAGAREVFIMQEPIAAAIALDLPINSSKASMVVDIGGGTSDFVIVSLGGIIKSGSVTIAGNKMDSAVIRLVRKKYNIVIGDKTAEDLKISTLMSKEHETRISVRGQDYATGLPSEFVISSNEIKEAIRPLLVQIVKYMKDSLEHVSPEIVSDLLDSGRIHIVGGGALIKEFKDLFDKELGVESTVAKDPQSVVSHGVLEVAKNSEKYSNFIIDVDGS